MNTCARSDELPRNTTEQTLQRMMQCSTKCDRREGCIFACMMEAPLVELEGQEYVNKIAIFFGCLPECERFANYSVDETVCLKDCSQTGTYDRGWVVHVCISKL